MYRVDPATADILETVDNNQEGGVASSVKIEGLAWDAQNNRLIAFDDNNNLYVDQTLENGNNSSLGSISGLTDVEALEFTRPMNIPGLYRNLATVTVPGAFDRDASHYRNPGPAPAQTITIEAEDYLTTQSPWTLQSDAGASGGQYLEVAPGSGDHYDAVPDGMEVTYAFTVDETGTYRVLGQVHGPDTSSNSFYVSIDGGAWIEFHFDSSVGWIVAEITDGPELTQVTFDLASGQHTMRVRAREDGATVDKWTLTNDPLA
ncbi:MAG: hypothetical protein CMJ18_01465 [Phycisphaeraceae bacterium]|nr:hypothetical protein [Phycisphaeraceae bacterium]